MRFDMDARHKAPSLFVWPSIERTYPNAGKEWIRQWVFPHAVFQVTLKATSCAPTYFSATSEAGIAKRAGWPTIQFFSTRAIACGKNHLAHAVALQASIMGFSISKIRYPIRLDALMVLKTRRAVALLSTAARDHFLCNDAV